MNSGKPETQSEWRWLEWKVTLGTVLILTFLPLFPTFLPHLVFQHVVSCLSPLNKHITDTSYTHVVSLDCPQFAAASIRRWITTMCCWACRINSLQPSFHRGVWAGCALPADKEVISSHSHSSTFSTVWVVFFSSSKSSYCFTSCRVAWHPTEPATAGYIHWMLNRQVLVG